MSLQNDLDTAKAEVARIESEIAAMPATIVGKTEDELVAIWHAIKSYFKGDVPEHPVVVVDAPVGQVAAEQSADPVAQ
jgi:hypothetical protein